jgi:hypothetical protein
MIFIGICVAVFLYQVNLPQEAAELFAFQYGAIPARLRFPTKPLPFRHPSAW